MGSVVRRDLCGRPSRRQRWDEASGDEGAEEQQQADDAADRADALKRHLWIHKSSLPSTGRQKTSGYFRSLAVGGGLTQRTW